MISLGGTIGAGLFIGIAEPLTQAGPLGTILAYFAAGLVMLGTMMCLGELATSFPHSGSFQYYAYKFFPSPLISYPENRGIYTQSDSPKKSSRNIWSLAVVSVDQRY